MPESRLPPRNLGSWDPGEGDVLAGFVATRETKDSQFRGEQVEVLTIDRGDGTTVAVWCGSTDLKALIEEQDPQPGDFLEARYDGSVRTRSGWTKKLYTTVVTKSSTA